MQPKILIVGAGPTGLVMALWLQRNQVPFRIIDQSDGPGKTSRALAVQARTLEFYRQLGIHQEIVDSGIVVRELQLLRRGRFVARAKVGAMGENLTHFPYLLFLSQDVHENILGQYLAKLGVNIEWQTELINLNQNDAGVTAILKTPRGQETARMDYLCGCDGAHSRTRHLLGIDFPGGTYEQVFFVADVVLNQEVAQLERLQISVSKAGFCIVMPIKQLNSVRLTGLVPREKETQDKIEFSDVADEVERNTGYKVKSVNWFTTYHVHHRVAEQFQKGRVFLCGDAGHIHSPAGGQGMNTGIGDAINLAWKLAAVVKSAAPRSLLDTYEPERIAFAKRLVATTDTAFKIIASRSIVGWFWRVYILPGLFSFVTQFKTVLRFMFRTLSQTIIRYRASVLSEGAVGDLHAGDRLPYVRFATGDNHASLNSLNWQIHVYGKIDSAFATAARNLNLTIHQFDWNIETKIKRFVRDSFYLIRPDGYIGLAHPTQEPIVLQTYVKQWIGSYDQVQGGS